MRVVYRQRSRDVTRIVRNSCGVQGRNRAFQVLGCGATGLEYCNYECEAGETCENGFCVTTEVPACTDTDNGLDTAVRGTATGTLNIGMGSIGRRGDQVTVTDQCLGTNLREWGCDATGYVTHRIGPCAAGQTCREGACVVPVEICGDDIDNNYNGLADEGCDDDNDDYCDSRNDVVSPAPSICPNGGGDCRDNSPEIYPGAPESCFNNFIWDDNCDDINQSCEPYVGSDSVQGHSWGTIWGDFNGGWQLTVTAANGESRTISDNCYNSTHINHTYWGMPPNPIGENNVPLNLFSLYYGSHIFECPSNAICQDVDSSGIIPAQCVPLCGNGILEEGEECDDGYNGYGTYGDGCTPLCTVQTCTDTDGGYGRGYADYGREDLVIQGTVQGYRSGPTSGNPLVTETDQCINSTHIQEYYCTQYLDSITWSYQPCPSEHMCYEGTCISQELCNGIDDNTNGLVDEGCIETCNDIDDNSNTIIDEGCDDDNDDYCDSTMAIVGIPTLCLHGGGDCRDSGGSLAFYINPGRREECFEPYVMADENCDGRINEDCAYTCSDQSGDNPLVGSRVTLRSANGQTHLRPDYCDSVDFINETYCRDLSSTSVIDYENLIGSTRLGCPTGTTCQDPDGGRWGPSAATCS